MNEIQSKEIYQGLNRLYASVSEILVNARKRAYTAVNFAMVESYWLIGQQIVEHEQHGEARANYGKGLLKELAARLTTDFGKGFDERELRKMRQFYQTFQKRDTLRPELTWSHYRRLISVENEAARLWYMYEPPFIHEKTQKILNLRPRVELQFQFNPSWIFVSVRAFLVGDAQP